MVNLVLRVWKVDLARVERWTQLPSLVRLMGALALLEEDLSLLGLHTQVVVIAELCFIDKWLLYLQDLVVLLGKVPVINVVVQLEVFLIAHIVLLALGGRFIFLNFTIIFLFTCKVFLIHIFFLDFNLILYVLIFFICLILSFNQIQILTISSLLVTKLLQALMLKHFQFFFSILLILTLLKLLWIVNTRLEIILISLAPQSPKSIRTLIIHYIVRLIATIETIIRLLLKATIFTLWGIPHSPKWVQTPLTWQIQLFVTLKRSFVLVSFDESFIGWHIFVIFPMWGNLDFVFSVRLEVYLFVHIVVLIEELFLVLVIDLIFRFYYLVLKGLDHVIIWRISIVNFMVYGTSTLLVFIFFL